MDSTRRPNPRTLLLMAGLTAAFAMLIVTTGGAAQRVVLGEYFTNKY